MASKPRVIVLGGEWFINTMLLTKPFHSNLIVQ